MTKTPTTKIIFYYTNKFNEKCFIKTVYSEARDLVIFLLEQEKLEKIKDVYYTVIDDENGIGVITQKLDYYNTIVWVDYV